MLTRATCIAGVATLALAGASSGIALAGPARAPRVPHKVAPYIVILSAPTGDVAVGAKAHITAHGHAPSLVELAVFASRREQCSLNASGEKASGGRLIIRKTVDGSFRESVEEVARQGAEGKHYACAYLYSRATQTLGHAEASWRVK